MTYSEIEQIFRHEASAILAIPIGDSYEKAINILYKQVHVRKGKLITSGMGKAGQIAMTIASKFSSTGTPALFLHPSEAQHGDLGVMQENDVLLLVSNSGKTRELIELVQLTRQLHTAISLIVITGNTDSPLAKEANVVLFTGAPAEVCPLGLTPTTSISVMSVISDALAIGVMKKTGFTSSDYNKRHQGGYLGQITSP